MKLLKAWMNWRNFAINACISIFCLLMNGCAVTTTASGHTCVGFSFPWLLICIFTGPIGITINVIYVICKLSGCSI